MTLPDPPCETTALQRGRTRDWGIYRSTWMLSGSGPELLRIDLAPHGDDEIDGQITQSGEHPREQVTGLEVEHGPEREVDGRRAVQAREPRRCGVLPCEIARKRTDGMRRGGERKGGVAAAGRGGRQDQIAAEQRPVRG